MNGGSFGLYASRRPVGLDPPFYERSDQRRVLIRWLLRQTGGDTNSTFGYSSPPHLPTRPSKFDVDSSSGRLKDSGIAGFADP